MGAEVTTFKTTRRRLRYSLAATLLLSCAPAALHAETSDKDEKIRKLETMMVEMQSQIRSLKAAVGEERVEGRRTREKVRQVAEKTYALPVPGMVVPADAVPAFITADKKLRFGALTITPGGFVAMESRFSTRNEGGDIGSTYQSIPLGGPNAGSNELRLTARQSRASVLAESPITPSVFASAYGEFDFLAAGVTSNSNESNSYVPRIRHLYGALDFNDSGFHVLAGQNWSLATLNSKGITPRNEVVPPTIDSQYVPGFTWKRQPQIRITKDFDKRLWLSLSAEMSQVTSGGVACPSGGANAYTGITTITNVSGVYCNVAGTNNDASTVNYSLDHVPDVIAKIAYETKLADHDVHLEGFGMYRDLYDRVALTNGTSSNRDTTGFGVGAGLIAAVVPKRLDFQASGMFGRGIGSYGTTQAPDSYVGADGSLQAIKQFQALGGLIYHATPAVDAYAFGGIERSFSSYYANGAAITTQGTGLAGYGIPNANDSGCGNVNNAATTTIAIFSGTTCAGATKQTYQATVGMWDKLYKGSFGEVRVGVQYSYTKRDLFASNFVFGGVSRGTFGIDDQSVLTSFRYYPFQ